MWRILSLTCLICLTFGSIALAQNGYGQAPRPDDRDPAWNDARAKAEAVDSPLAAMAIWHEFAIKHANSPRAEEGRQEVERWRKIAEDGAEKIKGRWVGGEELHALRDRAKAIVEEVRPAFDTDRPRADRRLREAADIYPKSTEVNFDLGTIAYNDHRLDDALKFFEVNHHLLPGSAEAACDFGIALATAGRWGDAIDQLREAARLRDSRQMVENLVTALATCPGDFHRDPRFDEADRLAGRLSARFGMERVRRDYHLLDPAIAGADVWDYPHWAVRNGVGFVVTPDGTILTSRHAVAGGTRFVARGDDRCRWAEVVAIDENADMALLHIDTDGAAPCLHFARAARPAAGADCSVLLYPPVDRLGKQLSLDSAVVRDFQPETPAEAPGADLLLDSVIHPCNSGSPVLNRAGRVVAMLDIRSNPNKPDVFDATAISADHIRHFLEAHGVHLPQAADQPEAGRDRMLADSRLAVVSIIAER